MKEAIKEAQRAAVEDEVPVGAVIVQGDRVISRGHNLREATNDPTGHAEIVAIRKACKKLKSWRLDGCRIYVSVEPCAMCAGTILWTRMDAVIYGADDPKGGACGTSFDLFSQRGINHRPEIKAGVLAQESQAVIKAYFAQKRK